MVSSRILRKRRQLVLRIQSVLAQCATALLTVLGLAQSMVLSLLNQFNESEPSRVMGCDGCCSIYVVSFLTHVTGEVSLCPVCGERTRALGHLPYLVPKDDVIFLVGPTGVTTGPYKNEEIAHERLWDWFEQKEKHEREERKNGQIINLPNSETKSSSKGCCEE